MDNNQYGNQTNGVNAGYNSYGNQGNLNATGYNAYGDQTNINNGDYSNQINQNVVSTTNDNVYGNNMNNVNNQYGYDASMNNQYNPYTEYNDVGQSSSFSYLPLIVVLLSVIAVGLAFLKYGFILGIITLIFSILKLKTKNKLYYIALGLSLLAIIIGLITTFNLFGKAKVPTPASNANDSSKVVALINDAHGIIDAVKKDVTSKGLKFKVYNKSEIEALTNGNYKLSPYNNEYDKISVSYIDNITSTDYSICLIDTAKNGFGYTPTSNLSENIVKVGTAPDNC